MENVLNAINRRCLSLNATQRKKNDIVHAVVETVLQSLNENKLFKALYNKTFFGGSFYDNLKVGSSNEFDIDLLLVLPEHISPSIEPSDEPGYVHVTVPDLEKLEENFKRLEKLCDPETEEISAKKMLSWFESLLTKCFNKLSPSGAFRQTVSVDGEKYNTRVKLVKWGPSTRVNIVAQDSDKIERPIRMNVHLVPCIVFPEKLWPSKSAGYRRYDSSLHGSSGTFFVVPKSPTGIYYPDFYWRLSFQEQERVLINGSGLGRMKPTLRLLKKIRDQWKHPISSYCIKTVFLWEMETRSKDFWNRPLCIVFSEMLEIYGKKLKSGSIPCFWNKNFNLLSDFKKSTLKRIANKMNYIVLDIKEWSEIDPFVVAKHIVSVEEVEILLQEVPMGKKNAEGHIERVPPNLFLNGPGVEYEGSSPNCCTVPPLSQLYDARLKKHALSLMSSDKSSIAENVVSSSSNLTSPSEETPHSISTALGLVIIERLHQVIELMRRDMNE